MEGNGEISMNMGCDFASSHTVYNSTFFIRLWDYSNAESVLATLRVKLEGMTAKDRASGTASIGCHG